MRKQAEKASAAIRASLFQLSMRIRELIIAGEGLLRAGGVEECKIDAEALLCFEIGCDRQRIFLDWGSEVDGARSESYFNLIGRRAAGEPLQYITGEQYFMGHRFAVGPQTLIPRPETEILAERAIAFVKAHAEVRTVLDLCTGSGALAVSLALACPHLKITASDISEQALITASKNEHALGAADRITFVNSDLFDSLDADSYGGDSLDSTTCGKMKNVLTGSLDNRESCETFGLIVTNPPYIKTADLASLAREIKDHEPLAALDGGADGLDFYRRIAKEAGHWLCPGGCLMAEIGAGQARDVAALFEAAGFTHTETTRDLSGFARVMTFTHR